MKTVPFTLETKEGRRGLDFLVRRMVNAGYSGRDQQEVRRHIEELRREGIPAPESTPTLYPVITDLLTLQEEIEVVGDRTSGEAEFVLLVGDEGCLVGVGSDHTDRELETVDITKAKQVCPNVMGSKVWSLDEVEDHWDALVLRSWVSEGGRRTLYQEAALEALLPPRELMAFVRSRLKDGRLEGTVIFSGTVSILTPEIIYGDSFEVELEDPVLGRRLSCRYRVKRLDYLF